MSEVATRGERAVLIVFGSLASIVALLVVDWPQNLWAILLGWLMMAISISDARRFIVPDVYSLPAIPAGLLASGYLGVSGFETLAAPMNIVAACVGALSFLTIRSGYLALRGRDGLGLGDVKLAAVAGAWTGLEGLLFVVLGASVSALIFVFILLFVPRRRGGQSCKPSATTAIPFGAFLAPAIWLVFVLQATLLL